MVLVGQCGVKIARTVVGVALLWADHDFAEAETTRRRHILAASLEELVVPQVPHYNSVIITKGAPNPASAAMPAMVSQLAPRQEMGQLTGRDGRAHNSSLEELTFSDECGRSVL